MRIRMRFTLQRLDDEVLRVFKNTRPLLGDLPLEIRVVDMPLREIKLYQCQPGTGSGSQGLRPFRIEALATYGPVPEYGHPEADRNRFFCRHL